MEKLSIFILLLLAAFTQQKPGDRCTGEGDTVCIDCKTVGVCASDGSVLPIEACGGPLNVCDSSIYDGICLLLNPSDTLCGCQSTNCIEDPNNSNAILHCESDGSTETCDDNETPNLVTCKCHPPTTTPPSAESTTTTANAATIVNCPSCGYIDDPNDSCRKFFICDGMIPAACPGILCFNQDTCLCE